MPSFKPINARSYYEFLPSSRHECGDIWLDLPSMGLLSARRHVAGLVVTPACDVSNFKAESATYLPILPIVEYLATVAFLPMVRREVAERYRSANLEMAIHWPDKGFEPPTDEALASELLRLERYLNEGKVSKSERPHLERGLAGLRIARVCGCASSTQASIKDFEVLYGSRWPTIKQEIVTNAFRPDIHFLPADDQEAAPGLSQHSVVLFRFPISIPSEILTAAQTVPESTWKEYMQSYRRITQAAAHFEERIPMKVLSIKSSFLSDLLSRFIGLYGRLGSPDFSRTTIERYSGEIE